MQILKNIMVGFAISFLGSLPLGFLNVVGIEVYGALGLKGACLFILGIILVQAIVCYYTLIFVNELLQNKNLMKWIEIFGIFFFLIIAYIFYNHTGDPAHGGGYLESYHGWPIFWVGAFLNSLNFLQIPFWLVFHLYFINKKYIEVNNGLKFYYVGGTMVGVFCGMLLVIYFLGKIAKEVSFLTDYIIPIILPALFVIMAIFQIYKVYTKYYFKKAKVS
ncbi:hypothetical protein [Flavobacterium algicola]|uniref:hypothetical protein n=1 Tax=Flavobacterium algicola TaxID=556529 RepID=UPI001EFDB484|nr:hypothetical protein [Flavobacterium algicola]MCG9794026.1 hypothetical protein [Flavobacterium algicola]